MASFACWIAAPAADRLKPTTAGMGYRSEPLDRDASIFPPLKIFVPGPGWVEITMPFRTVSLYASEKSIESPTFDATRSASALLSDSRAGAVVNRPSVRYQPARAADAEIRTTNNRASHPLRRLRARRSRSLAARRSAVGWCTVRANAGGGGASITVRVAPARRAWVRAAAPGDGTT